MDFVLININSRIESTDYQKLKILLSKIKKNTENFSVKCFLAPICKPA
jgi:hypothetical protein